MLLNYFIGYICGFCLGVVWLGDKTLLNNYFDKLYKKHIKRVEKRYNRRMARKVYKFYYCINSRDISHNNAFKGSITQYATNTAFIPLFTNKNKAKEYAKAFNLKLFVIKYKQPKEHTAYNCRHIATNKTWQHSFKNCIDTNNKKGGKS